MDLTRSILEDNSDIVEHIDETNVLLNEIEKNKELFDQLAIPRLYGLDKKSVEER